MTYSNGIDVSLWQRDITHALAGQQFCIIKTSQSNYIDPLAEAHVASCKAAGVEHHAYHWLDPTPSADEQAKVFLGHADPEAGFLGLDVEGRILRNMPVAIRMAREFIAYVHANDHRQIVLYSSAGTWPWNSVNVGEDGRWVADYSGPPDTYHIKWAIWQYKGIGLDRDYALPETLARLSGKTPPKPDQEPMLNLVPLTTHRVIDIPAGTVLTKTPGGDRFTQLSAPATLGYLGATNTHYCVADGDAGVYVDRATKGLAIRTADTNAGA